MRCATLRQCSCFSRGGQLGRVCGSQGNRLRHRTIAGTRDGGHGRHRRKMDRTQALGDRQKDNSLLGVAGWPILRSPGTKQGLIPAPTPKWGGRCEYEKPIFA